MSVAEEKRAAEVKKLELLIARNAVRAEIMRLRLENRERQIKLWKANKVMDMNHVKLINLVIHIGEETVL